MTLSELSVGQRVKVHPATHKSLPANTHATVTLICDRMVWVRFDRYRKARKLHPANLLPLED